MFKLCIFNCQMNATVIINKAIVSQEEEERGREESSRKLG